MIIPWKDSYCIDYGPIDEDHKMMLVLINNGIADLRCIPAVANISPQLARLRSCARAHFEREEMLQQSCGFPFQAEHRAEHRAVVKKLDDLISFADSGRAERLGHRPEAEMIRSMRSFFYGWLLAHIIESDMKMRPFAARMTEFEDNIVMFRATG